MVDPAQQTWLVERKAILRDSLGVSVATGAYAISFGAVSVAGGLSVWQTMALSLLMFSGGSQFGLIGVIAGGGSAWAGAATAVLLGVRNALYGLRLSTLLGLRSWRRVLAAQVVIDESSAMSMGRGRSGPVDSASTPPGSGSSRSGTSER